MNNITFETRDDILIARVHAQRLDEMNINDFLATIRNEHAFVPERGLLLDFADVQQLAEGAITPLILLHAEVRSHYHLMLLFHLVPEVRQFLEARKIDRFLTVCSDESAALELVATKLARPEVKGEKPAHYMKFLPGHHGSLDRIGGLPSHLPPQFPMTPKSSTEPKKKRRRNKEPIPVEMQSMVFTAQFYCTPERLNLPGALCVQIYQADPGIDPTAVVVVVPLDAQENKEGLGRINPEVIPHDIEWETQMDPATCPENVFDPICRKLMDSKIGGTTFFHDHIQRGETFLLQVPDDRLADSHGVNFGGYTLVMVADVSGAIHSRYG